MRKREIYIRKYGPEVGPKLYHLLQSQAAHAGVSARLRKKLDYLSGRTVAGPRQGPAEAPLPLFPDEPEGPTAEALVTLSA